jgi:hypothetical protein
MARILTAAKRALRTNRTSTAPMVCRLRLVLLPERADVDPVAAGTAGPGVAVAGVAADAGRGRAAVVATRVAERRRAAIGRSSLQGNMERGRAKARPLSLSGPEETRAKQTADPPTASKDDKFREVAI